MRLIDADLPMEQMEKLLDHHLMMGNFSADGAVSDCIEFLKTAPTIDAEPVRHGHWIRVKDNTFMSPCYECSACGRKINTWEKAEKSAPYCHCGAKMDEEVTDD